MHLSDANISVPIGDVGSITGRRDPVDASQPVRRWNHLWPVDAVDVESRVIEALAPGLVGCLRGGWHRWGKRNDRPHLEIAVRISIESFPDAGGEGVIDGRVAERAGDAKARERVLTADLYHRTTNSHHRIQPEQRESGGRALQIDTAALDALHHRRW